MSPDEQDLSGVLHLAIYDGPLTKTERAHVLSCECPPGCLVHPERSLTEIVFTQPCYGDVRVRYVASP